MEKIYHDEFKNKKSSFDEYHIRLDLRHQAKYILNVRLGFCAPVVVLLFLISALIAIITKFAWIILILSLIPFPYAIYGLIEYLISLYNINKGAFSVRSDIFKDTEIKEIFFPLLLGRTSIAHAFETTWKERSMIPFFFLKFEEGEWFLPEGYLYNWSESHKMLYSDFFREGQYCEHNEGDEFYVVTYNKSKKIGCAYNKKFFNLIERPRHDEKPEEKVFH